LKQTFGSVWEHLETIGHYLIHAAALILLSLLLAGKEVLPKFIADVVDDKKLLECVLVISASAFVAAVLALGRSLTEPKSTKMEVLSLGDAMSKALNGRTCKELRVYAISSRYIQIYVASAKFRSARAKVLLWNPQVAVHGETIVEKYSREIDQVIASGWNSQITREVVGECEIRRYTDLPDIYFALLDNSTAILGFYSRTMQPDTVVDFSPAILIERSSPETIVVIQSLMEHFESIWNQQRQSNMSFVAAVGAPEAEEGAQSK
jgi:hypothetical protein